MSVRNLLLSNDYNIICNNLESNNIQSNNFYSKSEQVVIFGVDFKVNSILTNATFIRNGDYIICSGQVNITLLNTISSLLVDLKILDFDEPFNDIKDGSVELLGGVGFNENAIKLASLYFIDYKGPTEVSFRYRQQDGTNFLVDDEFKLRYSFTYKQTTT